MDKPFRDAGDGRIEAYSFSTGFAWCSLRSAPHAQPFRFFHAKRAGALLSPYTHSLRSFVLRGSRQDVRTYERKNKRFVRSVYQFFEKRASCGCEDCRDEFLNPGASIARERRRKRWNVLPGPARKCLFKHTNSS